MRYMTLLIGTLVLTASLHIKAQGTATTSVVKLTVPIQRIENHEVEPSAHSLRRISHVLGEDLLTAKMKQQRRLQRVLSGIVAIWTLAIAYNVFFSPFDWTQRWYEILLWFSCLIGVVSGEIRFAYPRNK